MGEHAALLASFDLPLLPSTGPVELVLWRQRPGPQEPEQLESVLVGEAGHKVEPPLQYPAGAAVDDIWLQVVADGGQPCALGPDAYDLPDLVRTAGTQRCA